MAKCQIFQQQYETNNLYSKFSVDECYYFERVFQVYWLVTNFLLVAFIESFNQIKRDTFHSGPADTMPRILGKTCGYSNHLILTCFVLFMGVISFSLFLWQRNSRKRPEKPTQKEKGTSLLDHVLNAQNNLLKGNFSNEISLKERIRCAIIGCLNLGFSIAEYSTTLMTALNLRSSNNPIWAAVTLAIPFLPGIEWNSKTHLRGTHRLRWLLYSLFFPFTVLYFRVRCDCAAITFH